MYKLLIVDDEPLTRQFFRMNVGLLHPQWICADEAGDGGEALAHLDEGRTYDLIVTDIRMPGMSGLELARELAARRAPPHVVILSGYDEFALAKEAMEYGVQYYLLKPVVNEELVDVLGKLAAQLTAQRAEETAYRTLLSLSSETREQVARNFLRAVVADNNMEIKVLYPMLHRLKISLLDAEGAILMVELDESQLLERDISFSHATLYRYIVNQTAAELAASGPGTISFIDNEERTVIFVAGDDADDVLRRGRQLFRELASTIAGMTGLRLWGAYGDPEMDVLQLNVSYRKARAAIKEMLFADPGDHANLLTGNEDWDLKRRKLEAAVAAFLAATSDNNALQQHAALQAMARELEPIDRRRLILFGRYLLKRMNDGLPGETGQERSGSAVQALLQRTRTVPERQNYTQEEAIALFREMLEAFHAHGAPNDSSQVREANEHEIVTRVKAYILDHFAEPLSLAHIAEKMGVSPSYLSSLFHQNTQESYIKFLTRVRMEHAASLLRKKPPEKVYDVAEKVGYLSVKHFSYVFKQHFGYPPGQYQDKALR